MEGFFVNMRKFLFVIASAALIFQTVPETADFVFQPVMVTASAEEKLPAPENVKITVSGDKAVITWDKVKGSDACKVFKYDGGKKKYVKIKTVSGTKASISGLAAGKHYFKIAAAVKTEDGKYTTGKASAKITASVKSAASADTPKTTSSAGADSQAVKLADAMGNGWNLGNTMESVAGWLGNGQATDYERAWGQPLTTKEMITALKNSGFSSVRIPVAWSNMISSDGSYTISQSYFDRVDEIVGYVLDNNMYCIINIHWDGGWWEDFGSSDSRKSKAAMDRYKAMWTQIATHYAGYSDKLIFESANEELGSATKGSSSIEESYKRVNEINQTFVDIIRSTGSGNAERFLLIAGYDTDIDKTTNDMFEMPSDTVKNRLLVSVHYYTPSTFCIAGDPSNSWGYMDSWGTDEDIEAMNNYFAKMKKFTDAGYGVIIGEYGVAKKAGAGQVKSGTYDFFENVVKLSDKYGYCAMLWDCNDWFSRDNCSLKYKELEKIYS